MLYKRSVSPLIATILLIVVSVILITVVLTWGSSFAKDSLSQSNQFSENTKSDLSSFVAVTAVQQLSESNVITIRNLHSTESITFIGYNLITKDSYVFANQKLYFDNVITLEPGAITSLNLICLPSSSFTLQLFDQDQTYVTLPITVSNYRSQAYCMGRDGVVAAYDMTKITDNSLIDLSGQKNGIIFGLLKTDFGLFNNSLTDGIHISNASIISQNEYTIVGKIKINNAMSSDGVLFSNASTNNLVIDSFGIRDSKFAWNFDGSGTYKNGASTNLVLDNWYTFTFVSDGGRTGSIKIYINGINDLITSTAFYRSGTTSRIFSRNSGNGFLGEISDLRFFNRLFTEKEIYDYHSVMINPLE